MPLRQRYARYDNGYEGKATRGEKFLVLPLTEKQNSHFLFPLLNLRSHPWRSQHYWSAGPQVLNTSNFADLQGPLINVK